MVSSEKAEENRKAVVIANIYSEPAAKMFNNSQISSCSDPQNLV